MIYLCEPCKLACKGCEKTCAGFSNACRETCKGIGDICSRPMGGWVLMTVLSQTLIIAGAVWTVIQIMDADGTPEGADCDSPKMSCFINIGLGVMHILVSVYVQNAIVQKVIKEKEAEGADVENITAEDIMKATKHIIAYDFVFCFYVFALPGSAFYNCYGISQLNGSACSAGYGPAWAAAMCMIGYGFATMCYLPCMYCGTCCAAGSKKVKKSKKADKKGGTPATVAESAA